ncbi:hypothetical protein LCGC14_1969440 [marine sediment metagenome]|uniref:Uncharacterized protein n=1 Tax=marine sediment metagenome TaxID=412755 RepID=A0A0F9FC73_9ZZZZ
MRRVSKKRQAILTQEAIQLKIMLEQSNGLCWICKKRRAVEKSHTKKRDRFVPSCRECHSPDGKHKYLEE